MKFLWILVAYLASAVAQPIELTEEYFRLWDMKRLSTFLDNQKFINEHNAKFARGEVTFQVGVNQFADMTKAEFNAMMNGFRVPAGYNRTGDVFMAADGVEVPPSVDWRKKGAVTPVKDQGQCGSCWAFSATGSMEGQNFLIKKDLVSLSEQNLVDCSTEQGNGGCRGGTMNQAFNYVQINGGIDTETSYPYKAREGVCRYNTSNNGATVNGHVDIPQGNESLLQWAVAQIGPISVAIDAGHPSFMFYHRGIYNEARCSTRNLVHAVLVVGYGTSETGTDYWIVKNSWGKKWGMAGYILMARNKGNMCGIATMASYPTM